MYGFLTMSQALVTSFIAKSFHVPTFFVERRGRAGVLEVALGGYEYEWGRWEGLGDLGDDGVLNFAETLEVHRRVTHNQKVRLRNRPDSLRFHWKTGQF